MGEATTASALANMFCVIPGLVAVSLKRERWREEGRGREGRRRGREGGKEEREGGREEGRRRGREGGRREGEKGGREESRDAICADK